MGKKVLLTGITGYIGQHCAAELLKAGYEVVGTMRSKAKAKDTERALSEVADISKLTIVEADLLSDKGWDKVVKGCDYVMHVASPFVLSDPEDENELIEPAVEGTKRVLAAAMKAGVKRTVLTSSIISAIAGKPSGTYGPDDWADVNAEIGAYAKSKALAEQTAWDMVKGSKMELVAINPGGVFGPTLGAKIDGQSVAMMKDMLEGKMPMVPDITLGMVDVRDVAKLHVQALSAKGVNGKRFMASSAEPIAFIEVARTLSDAGYKKVSTRQAPTLLMKFMGIFNKEIKGMLPIIGKRIHIDNSATIKTFKWKPISFEKTVKDMAASLSK